ncbi:MAG TPA: YkgJ family cysteine cluster protein [Nitrospirota bacterium]|nr:YkgJ family cysteine cluster protein [Nitrospirota bacterium]
MKHKKEEMKPEEIEVEPIRKGSSDKVIPVKLTGKSRFKFRCHKGVRCFTACCSNINIVLPPFDLLRLRKRLGMTAEDFINAYCQIEILAKTLLPVITLKMKNDEKQSCPFLTPGGCTVYEDRPNICRYYPVGMATLRKKDSETGRDEFYFMTKEDHCKGFEEDKEWTIAEWRKDQQADLHDEINRGWMEILIKKKSFGEREFPEIKNQMFFMVSTNTDYFRDFVFSSSFLETYDIPEERIEKVRSDDAELLKLGYEWLRSAMFAEETLPFRKGVLEARKDRADVIMKKVYGNKPKSQIGDID